MPSIKSSCGVFLFVTALLPLITDSHAASRKAGPMPDLTAGGKPDDTGATPLGPTGMRGWMYHEHLDTSKARQILVTTVDAGSPSEGKLAPGDVILGASGNGGEPGNFQADARRQFAEAINLAEEKEPSVLRLSVWRKGKSQTVSLQLKTMGAYSATAPFDCPKSARILENGLDHAAGKKNFGKFDFGVIGLLAGHDPANPKDAERMKAVRERLPLMLVSDEERTRILKGEVETGGLTIPWKRGHTLIALAEYYLQTKDKSVLPSIEACAVSIANGQSIYGTMGHLYQRRGADGDRGSITGYGPVNSAAMPALLGLVLARECGIKHPDLEPAIRRGALFFGYYAGKGAIPYGEHPPIFNSHENNGKSGLAAVIMRELEGQEEKAAFYAKMAAASFEEREGGHTGPYFNNLWAPLGSLAGSKEALIMHFRHIRWQLDLCRQWDGGFAFSKILGKKDQLNYSGMDSNVPALLTYAAPLRSLVITGKKWDKALLSGEDVREAESAALYVAASRSDEELVSDFSRWSPKVKWDSSIEIAKRDLDRDKLTTTLFPIATKPDHPGRVAALWTLGRAGSPRSARVLADTLTDPDPLARFVAAESMRLLPPDLIKPEVEKILKACISTSKPALPLDPADPVQFAHGRLCMLLFYGGSAYGPKGILSGEEVKDIDRSLLYPAIRAVSQNPSGQCRATLKFPYQHLTEDDVIALADELVTAVVERAPADSMFSRAVRTAGVRLLREHGYIEADKAAAIVIDETNDNRKQQAIDELRKPDGLELKKTFKQIESLAATPSLLKLPARTAKLKAVSTDQVNGANIFTWKMIAGPGDVRFSPNGTAEAAECEVTLDKPGKYSLEVTVSDPLGLSQVSGVVDVTLEE